MAKNARRGKQYQFDASQARWKLGVKAGQTSQAWKKSVARMQGK
ncbi:hypothetical protein HanXRQr2_Chr05g0208861 [Helianthus annuus]|uniref:Uncharacterized protein n=1 Tax=Helianthus annuus TaxID=4232 RepID=A0A9K3NLV4_HELAN|nr:hypothetical protein HanXRQr2_Chr05g0208861 [Helianthus annuus]KAJ0922278.1 hypothetical protein HanPSC8_Chr05g0201831 [Helianthus annuus]